MKNLKLFYLSAILFFATTSFAQFSDTLLCGSVSAYLQTKHWEDLPGCNGDYKGGQDDWNTPKSLSGYAKTQLYKFYKLWYSYKFSDNDLLNSEMDCIGFKNSGDEYWNNDPELKEAAAYYKTEADKVKVIYETYTKESEPVLDKIFQSYFYCETYSKLADQAFEEAKGKKNYGEIASAERSVLSGNLVNMKEALKEAEVKKIAGTFVIHGSGDIKEATIDQIKQVHLKKWEAASNSANAKAKEAYEAELGPYLKLLSGDKAKEFREWYGLNFYGYNGKLLKTPEEIAASPVWFRIGNPPCTICPRWELSGVIFSGMIRKGYTSHKGGYGTYPPDSEFK